MCTSSVTSMLLLSIFMSALKNPAVHVNIDSLLNSSKPSINMLDTRTHLQNQNLLYYRRLKSKTAADEPHQPSKETHQQYLFKISNTPKMCTYMLHAPRIEFFVCGTGTKQDEVFS